MSHFYQFSDSIGAQFCPIQTEVLIFPGLRNSTDCFYSSGLPVISAFIQFPKTFFTTGYDRQPRVSCYDVWNLLGAFKYQQSNTAGPEDPGYPL